MYNSKIKASSFLKRRNSSSQAAPFYPKFHLNEEELFFNDNSVDFFLITKNTIARHFLRTTKFFTD